MGGGENRWRAAHRGGGGNPVRIRASRCPARLGLARRLPGSPKLPSERPNQRPRVGHRRRGCVFSRSRRARSTFGETVGVGRARQAGRSRGREADGWLAGKAVTCVWRLRLGLAVSSSLLRCTWKELVGLFFTAARKKFVSLVTRPTHREGKKKPTNNQLSS